MLQYHSTGIYNENERVYYEIQTLFLSVSYMKFNGDIFTFDQRLLGP